MMPQSVYIFVSGLGGVFLGMALLYVSIRVTAFMLEKWVRKEEAE